jgi:hypothetical protein
VSHGTSAWLAYLSVTLGACTRSRAFARCFDPHAPARQVLDRPLAIEQPQFDSPWLALGRLGRKLQQFP